MKALVTGAGALLGQGIIRSLQLSPLNAHIIAVDPSPLAAGLYWADTRYLVPMATAPDYLQQIRKILSIEKPDVVLIGTDVELMTFAQNRGDLEADFGTHIAVSSPDVIAIADDKYRTYEFLRNNGFPHPLTCLKGDEQALIDLVGFPLIVKPRVGARSVGMHVVHSLKELQSFLTDDIVIQEYVASPHDEYTAGVLFFEKSCASIVMRRDLRDGNTYRAYLDAYPELNDFVKQIGEVLGGYGPLNFQFRLTRDGTAKIFEINARFSGTTILRAHAGFNEVEMVIRHILFGELISQPAVPMMTFLRHWSETIVQQTDITGVRQP